MRNRNDFMSKMKGMVILASIAIAVSAFAVPAAAEIDLRIVHVPYLPLSVGDFVNNQSSGFNVELMTKITEMDSELSIAESDVMDLMDAVYSVVNTDYVNMIMPVDQWDYKSEADIYKQHPYLNSVPVILASKDLGNPNLAWSGINGLEDLKGKNVICSKKALDEIIENIDSYNSTHTDNSLDFNLVEGQTGFFDYESFWYSLLNSDASAALMPLQNAAYYVKNEPDKFNIIEIPDADQLFIYSYWIAYAVDYPDYNPEGVAAKITVMERMDADIDALIADGTYAQLCEEYLGVDLTPYYELVGSQSEDTVPGTEQIEGTDTEDEAAVKTEEVTAEETAATVYTDKETVIKVQQALNDAGYNCGTPDGVAGSKTNQAVIDYKAANGLGEGSDITDQLLDSLGIAQ